MTVHQLHQVPTNRAHSIKVMSCGSPKCRQPHLVLLDADGCIIADAVIGRDRIDWLYTRLSDVVAAIDAGLDDDGHPRA
jgi:hypothetical protein